MIEVHNLKALFSPFLYRCYPKKRLTVNQEVVVSTWEKPKAYKKKDYFLSR